MKKILANLGTSALISYPLLKITSQSIDPYTRTLIGSIIGIYLASTNKYIGTGISLGSGLQLLEIKGGRLSFNNSLLPVFVLKENGGVVELDKNEIPNYYIDGFTIQGYNGVFKLSDRVYAGINNNRILYSPGVGGIINSLKGAGKKDLAWCQEKKDKGDGRWLDLFNRSL